MDTPSIPMRTSSGAVIPSWLETPPLSPITPPIETRHQELPFELLEWEDFEKLCLRLARLEADVEDCREYGVRGQEQGGIDLYARRRFAEKYTVYQCKREHDFGPAKIKEAVTKFLEGEWASTSDTFVLCTTESLRSTPRTDEVERQRSMLRDRGIALETWDSSELSPKLKGLPNLVDDFFSREWVRVFCGPDAANSLGNRLDAASMVEFRKRLFAFYGNVFNTHDPGLPSTALGELSVLDLEQRYVIPDIYDRRPISISFQQSTQHETHAGVEGDDERSIPDAAAATPSSRRPMQRISHHAATFRPRQGVESWLAAAGRSIVLGGPGSGKSSLLRFLAIDLLRESPRLTTLAPQWGGLLPVWIPFALWTKMIAHQPPAECSLSDLLRAWFKSLNEEHLWPLIQQALEDKRLLLLVDGLDEWTNEEAARVALERLQVFIAQRHVPAVVTSRPHGFDRLGMQAAGWQIGELSDFSPTQQRQLAHVWFLHKNTATSPGSSELPDLERRAETETAEFLTELSRSPDLQELAKVPLLLCLLISHRFLNARLPQGRFRSL